MQSSCTGSMIKQAVSSGLVSPQVPRAATRHRSAVPAAWDCRQLQQQCSTWRSSSHSSSGSCSSNSSPIASRRVKVPRTCCAGTSSTSSTSIRNSSSSSRSPSSASDVLGPTREVFDVVVIGSGIGGLSCGALLAHYGLEVLVVEAHSVAGGAAHCWTRRGCHFDSGTALFFGLPAQQQQQQQQHPSAAAAAAVADGAALAARIASSSSASTSSSSGSGSSGPQPSRRPVDHPLTAVLQILGQQLDLIPYGPDRTWLVFPQGAFKAQIGSELFPAVVRQLWGPSAEQEWLGLQQLCRDLAAAAAPLHPVVVRYDPCIALTAGLRRPGRFVKFLASQPDLMKQDVMFSQLVASVVTTPALRDFLDVLCKGTSGAAAADLLAAYMVRAFAEMYQPGTQLQWPRGGPQAIADALVRGLRQHGGKLLLNSPVAAVLSDGGPASRGRAAGVVLKGGQQVAARVAVVSNASLWDTCQLLPEGAVLPGFQEQLSLLQPCDSFVHLHAVVDSLSDGSRSSSGGSNGSSGSSSKGSSALTPEQLPVHTYFLAPELVGDTGWPTLTISTAVDPSLAPPGKQILHAYMAEPFAAWDGLQRGSTAYESLKAQKADVLWGLVQQVLPAARQHLDWQMVGTPLTHQHFRRRFQGAYGVKTPLDPFAASRGGSSSSGSSGGQGATGAAAVMQPQAVMAMKGLYCCGDNTFPYVGTPAVAASGMWVANTLAPVWKHWQAANVVDS